MTRTDSTLEARYFDRMAKSLGDKMRIVENLPPVTNDYSPKVLDVGAGGGDFSHALSELGYTVTALDASDDAIMRMREKYPDLTTAHMLANEADRFGPDAFDAVVCSSILHEVFSYGDNDREKGDYDSVYEALKSFHKILTPGGALIIRDGVKPDNWQTLAKLRMKPKHLNTPVYDYLNQCPFANGRIPGDTGRLIKLSPSPDGWWTGNLLSAFEFFMTYNWGVENYHREAQELYGVFTLDQYTELLTTAGFLVDSAEKWVQEDFPKYLSQKVELITNEGYDVWPATNALWVSHKS